MVAGRVYRAKVKWYRRPGHGDQGGLGDDDPYCEGYFTNARKVKKSKLSKDVVDDLTADLADDGHIMDD